MKMRRFQFGVRDLLLAATVCAVLLGWYVDHARMMVDRARLIQEAQEVRDRDAKRFAAQRQQWAVALNREKEERELEKRDAKQIHDVLTRALDRAKNDE